MIIQIDDFNYGKMSLGALPQKCIPDVNQTSLCIKRLTFDSGIVNYSLKGKELELILF